MTKNFVKECLYSQNGVEIFRNWFDYGDGHVILSHTLEDEGVTYVGDDESPISAVDMACQFGWEGNLYPIFDHFSDDVSLSQAA